MKKFILATMSLALIGSASFAQNSAIVEQEDGPIATADMAALESQTQAFGGKVEGAIIGGVIGGIIGAIAADSWDHNHGFRDYNVTCFAQNRRGEIFRATAMRPRVAQNKAMNKCYNFSQHCRPVGCR